MMSREPERMLWHISSTSYHLYSCPLLWAWEPSWRSLSHSMYNFATQGKSEVSFSTPIDTNYNNEEETLLTGPGKISQRFSFAVHCGLHQLQQHWHAMMRSYTSYRLSLML